MRPIRHYWPLLLPNDRRLLELRVLDERRNTVAAPRAVTSCFTEFSLFLHSPRTRAAVVAEVEVDEKVAHDERLGDFCGTRKRRVRRVSKNLPFFFFLSWINLDRLMWKQRRLAKN